MITKQLISYYYEINSMSIRKGNLGLLLKYLLKIGLTLFSKIFALHN
jgi:hypothetical protein